MSRKSANLILTPKRLVLALIASVLSGNHSLRQIAFEVGMLVGPRSASKKSNAKHPSQPSKKGTRSDSSKLFDTYSKQALWARLNDSAVEFIKAVVGKALAKSAQSISPLKLSALSRIRRILVGDSTTFQLHSSLRERFPGASNQHGAQCAQVRFQLTFDLLSGKWIQAQSDPYNRNDRSATQDIVRSGLLQKGDLIIRDLGYAVLNAFAAIAAVGAFFLSRFNTSAALYDEEERRLNLLELARRKTPTKGDTASLTVYVGKKQQLQCRLVLRHEAGNVGEIRRRKLNQEAKRRGMTYRADYRALQDWTIMITNLTEEQASDEQVCELYRLRWRIENVFKVAKSHTRLTALLKHRSNGDHIEVLLWGWVLAMIHLGALGIFSMVGAICDAGGSVVEIQANEHSVFKAIERLMTMIATGIELQAAGNNLAEWMGRYLAQHEYHDRYEERRDRETLAERAQKIFEAKQLIPSLP